MPENLTFVGHQRPALPGGDYTITLTQTVDLDAHPFTATRTFTVGSERYALPPTAIRSVFPPDGGLGDHTTVLPHVILDRPTLPWERDAGTGGPWLVLLLFSGDERPEPQTVTVGTLGAGGAHYPVPPAEKHDGPDDPVTVIDVPRVLLDRLMPSPADLDLLAHVRRADDDAAVVLGHRTPPAGASSTVHLVSVEGRYTAAGFDLGPDEPGALVRMVSLASWRFACLDESHTFPYLARALADEGSPLRLPDSGQVDADAYLRQGYVPVRHLLRQGGRTVSWYRGPFVTGPVPDRPRTAVRTADQLLRYRPDTGMLDASYAAAWQLGRLLALQHTTVATELHAWKRRRAQALARTTPEDHPLDVAVIDDAMPTPVKALLTDFAQLNGVPLRYLLPDERLLPPETIRFLQVDQQWISHLVDGAYSIGRLTRADADTDLAHPPLPDAPVLTGALIRSELISGYPGLLIDAYPGPDATDPLDLHRCEKLSEQIMLILFTGTLGRLDLHQPPEAQHFAVEPLPDGHVGKTLRGTEHTASAPAGPLGTVPVSSLAAQMADLTGTAYGSGEFALQMIETAERVTYLRAVVGALGT